ncbi:protein-L-isoaspartate O-methyltransferase [Lyophyllum atratum]|nr:protein-L-isoaspartate O-methyltransferase [Lyophyllum atratum]
MAWRSSGKSNKELISNMSKAGIFKSERVAKAMEAVDRANYVQNKSAAYEDAPQSIGYGATISAPHMHAYAAEHLLPYLRPGSRVLDVGSGSGYLTAVFHHLTEPTGTVVGIDHIPELVQQSVENLKKDGLGEAVEKGRIIMVVGDGREGAAVRVVLVGPYDAIHVGAASPDTPVALIEQLASPGRIFVPVGKAMQYIQHINKDADGNVSQTQVMGVSYVPLTDPETQKNTF